MIIELNQLTKSDKNAKRIINKIIKTPEIHKTQKPKSVEIKRDDHQQTMIAVARSAFGTESSTKWWSAIINVV